MAAPNLLAVSTITADSKTLKSTTSFVTVVSNTAASGKRYRVYDLGVYALVTGALASLDLFDGTTSFPIMNALPLGQSYGGVQVCGDNVINLLEGWSIRFKSASAADCMVACSWDVWT